MKICLLLPYAGESHLYWANQLKKNSQHQIDIFKMPPRYWKWRMHGSASYFAKELKNNDKDYDILLTTSFLNILELKALLPSRLQSLPIHLYFHENQFSYPISNNDPDKGSERMEHYQFIQLMSYIYCDKVYFNSHFNKQTFIQGANNLLKKLPDYSDHLNELFNKKPTTIWPLYFDLIEYKLNNNNKSNKTTFIWNHRWEDDKNPEGFFDFLKKEKETGSNFDLIILGKQNNNKIFKKAKNFFDREIIHYGTIQGREQYLKKVQESTISIITSFHDFFGISAIEGLLCNVKTYFPRRLVYKEHFKPKVWERISYEKPEHLHKLIKEPYPLEEAKESIISKYCNFLDIDEV